jgi:hypothetical protein
VVIVEIAGIKKLKILVMVNTRKNSRVEYLDQVISCGIRRRPSSGRAPGPGLKPQASSSKPQATETQAASDKQQATSYKLQAGPFKLGFT